MVGPNKLYIPFNALKWGSFELLVEFGGIFEFFFKKVTKNLAIWRDMSNFAFYSSMLFN